MDVKEEAILGSTIGDHWYYVAKGRALRAFLGPEPVGEVLDVGAGSGVFTRQLLDCGLAFRGTCVDPAYETERTELHNGHEIVFTRSVNDVSQRLILMMDVLEHVDDDLALLTSYTADMLRDGRVLITVPAFQFLWSGHDVFLEHRRRYTLPGIEALVRRAGLRVTRGRYFFGILFPLVAVMRLRDRKRMQTGEIEAKSQLSVAPPLLNSVLVGIHEAERAVLFPGNRIAGLTAFCLATRAWGSGSVPAGYNQYNRSLGRKFGGGNYDQSQNRTATARKPATSIGTTSQSSMGTRNSITGRRWASRPPLSCARSPRRAGPPLGRTQAAARGRCRA